MNRLTYNDTENSQNVIGSAYNHTSATESIFIREKNSDPSRYIISYFDLVRNQNSNVNPSPNLVNHNNDFDFALMTASNYWFVANVKKGNEQFRVKGHFALRC